jgi:hypothetical protein
MSDVPRRQADGVTDPDPYLTIHEASAFVKLHAQTLRLAVREGA